MYTPPVRGKFVKKAPVQQGVALINSTSDVAVIYHELKYLKEDIINTVDSELDKMEEKSDKSIKKVEDAVTSLEHTTTQIVDYVKTILKGDPGEPANEEQIIKKVSDIVKLDKEEIIKEAISKFPSEKIDIKGLKKEILASIPDRKADLKIIQENIEIDPMSVIDKIMALPEEKRSKLQLGTNNISGLEQTMSAFRNQLGRGYIHGGGLSTISHDSTLTGLGTPQSPLSVVSSSSILLQTNNTDNTLQSKLNLIQGNNVTITSDAFGGVTINATPGVQSINGDSNSSQVFVMGNDTAGGTQNAPWIYDDMFGGHTINLPVATSVVTGPVSNTDWSTFNGKIGGSASINQVAFGNGTNTLASSAVWTYDGINMTFSGGYANFGTNFNIDSGGGLQIATNKFTISSADGSFMGSTGNFNVDASGNLWTNGNLQDNTVHQNSISLNSRQLLASDGSSNGTWATPGIFNVEHLLTAEHFGGNGPAPTATPVGASTSNITTGSDASFVISIGASGTTGGSTIATVTFNTTYTTAPNGISISPIDSNSAISYFTGQWFVTNITATGFDISSTTLTGVGTFNFSITVVK